MVGSHQERPSTSPYRVAATMFALMGIVWAAVALFIVVNGEPIYGSLYSAPVLVSLILSYGFWSVGR